MRRKATSPSARRRRHPPLKTRGWPGEAAFTNLSSRHGRRSAPEVASGITVNSVARAGIRRPDTAEERPGRLTAQRTAGRLGRPRSFSPAELASLEPSRVTRTAAQSARRAGTRWRNVAPQRRAALM